MQSSQNVSHHKIVMLLVFVCAAIMSSVFIYHTRQSQEPRTLSPDTGIIFNTPREIKPFDLVRSDGAPFTQKDFYHHWTLLFFGFTHCSNVCPTTLAMLNRVYTPLHDKHPTLQVVLISLDPERDSTDVLAKYTRDFNPNFIGISGKIQNLRQLQSQLGVYSAKETGADRNNNYQIQHTSSIMLINPEGKWAGLFKFGLKPEQFVQGLELGISQGSPRKTA